MSNNYNIYKFVDSEENILYIGKSKNIKERIYNHFSISHLPEECLKYLFKIEYITVESEYEMNLIEQYLISTINPKYNTVYNIKQNYKYIYLNNLEWKELKRDNSYLKQLEIKYLKLKNIKEELEEKNQKIKTELEEKNQLLDKYKKMQDENCTEMSDLYQELDEKNGAIQAYEKIFENINIKTTN